MGSTCRCYIWLLLWTLLDGASHQNDNSYLAKRKLVKLSKNEVFLTIHHLLLRFLLLFSCKV